MKKEITHKIEITPKSFFILFGIIALIWVFMNLYDLFFAVFLAFIISAFFRPAYNWLRERRINSIIALGGIYTLSFSFVALLLFVASRPIVNEFQNFAEFLAEEVPILSEFISVDENENLLDIIFSLDAIQQFLPGITSAFGVIGETSWVLLLTVTIIAVSAYMLVYHKNLMQSLEMYLPKSIRSDVIVVIGRIEKNLGLWMYGQILLGIIIGALSYIGMLMFGIKFALTIGIIGGLLELLPVVGPVVLTVVSLAVAYADGQPVWILALVLLWNIFIQQVENAVIVPKVMQRVVGINPILVIISIIGGLKLFGLLGGVLAVPIVVILQIILDYRIQKSKSTSHA